MDCTRDCVHGVGSGLSDVYFHLTYLYVTYLHVTYFRCYLPYTHRCACMLHIAAYRMFVLGAGASLREVYFHDTPP